MIQFELKGEKSAAESFPTQESLLKENTTVAATTHTIFSVFFGYLQDAFSSWYFIHLFGFVLVTFGKKRNADDALLYVRQ